MHFNPIIKRFNYFYLTESVISGIIKNILFYGGFTVDNFQDTPQLVPVFQDIENIIKTIEELGYSPTIRGETLSLQEFATLSEALRQKVN